MVQSWSSSLLVVPSICLRLADDVQAVFTSVRLTTFVEPCLPSYEGTSTCYWEVPEKNDGASKQASKHNYLLACSCMLPEKNTASKQTNNASHKDILHHVLGHFRFLCLGSSLPTTTMPKGNRCTAMI